MNTMETKVSAKEEAQRREEADRLYQERLKSEAEKAKQDQSSDFLSNLTSYKVE
jgi:wobble nucleotide-excising tRNase